MTKKRVPKGTAEGELPGDRRIAERAAVDGGALTGDEHDCRKDNARSRRGDAA